MRKAQQRLCSSVYPTTRIRANSRPKGLHILFHPSVLICLFTHLLWEYILRSQPTVGSSECVSAGDRRRILKCFQILTVLCSQTHSAHPNSRSNAEIPSLPQGLKPNPLPDSCSISPLTLSPSLFQSPAPYPYGTFNKDTWWAWFFGG